VALIAAKLVNPHFTACRKRWSETASTGVLPSKPAKNRVAIVMLVICPITLMVAAVPEAIPYWVLLTELIMVFMFGEEKKANPKPTHINNKTIINSGVDEFRKAKAASPVVHIAIPVVVRYLG